jgi:tRNA(adenine34) deaminase
MTGPWHAPAGGDMAAYETAMRAALAAARAAAEHDEVPVGAVVLDPGGVIVGAAGNERESRGDPTAHAEVLALREAGGRLGTWRLTGCTLVVTLEPCTMCAGAAVAARIDRIVYGPPDAKAGAVGSLWDVVRDRRLNHRPEVIGGLLADECAALLTEFFTQHREGGEPAESGPAASGSTERGATERGATGRVTDPGGPVG